MISLSHYSQIDPRWADKPLGTSGRTMRTDGCVVTATASQLEAFGIKVTPGQLCDALNAHGGFDPSGFMRWDVLCKLYPQLSFYGAFITTNHQGPAIGKVDSVEAVRRIQRLVRLGQPVGLYVDHSLTVPGEDHYVMLYDAPDNLDQWMIHDPDTTPSTGPLLFKVRYGSPLSGIYQYRVLLGPPTMFPDDATLEMVKEGGAVGKLVDPRYTKKDVLDILIT